MENYDKNKTSSCKTILESRNDHTGDDIVVSKNSIFKKLTNILSNWAGVMALLISIAVGVFTVIDQTLIAPNERRNDDLANLSEIIVELGRANLTVA